MLKERQLEACLSSLDALPEFLSSEYAKTFQICSVRFESTLRRIAKQAIFNQDVEVVCNVLRAIKYLCEQNQQKGIHVLLRAGFSDIFGEILIFISELLIDCKSNSGLVLLGLFMEDISLVIPLLNDHCCWLKSNIAPLMKILDKCYLQLEISSMLIDGINQVVQVLDTEETCTLRMAVCENDFTMAVCKHIMCRLNELGDYQIQNGLLELVVRLTPSKVRQDLSLEWNNSNTLHAQKFNNISYQEFDLTSRSFLNLINSQSTNLGVKSVPLKEIKIGDMIYDKDCWLDLCFRSQRVTFSFTFPDEENTPICESLKSGLIRSHQIEEKSNCLVVTFIANIPLRKVFEDDAICGNASFLIVYVYKRENLTYSVLKKMLDCLLNKNPSMQGLQIEVCSQYNDGKLSKPNAQYVACQTVVCGNEEKCNVPTDFDASENIVPNSQFVTCKQSKVSNILPLCVGSGGARKTKAKQGWKFELQETKENKFSNFAVSEVPCTSEHDMSSQNHDLFQSSMKMSRPYCVYASNTSHEIVPETQVVNAVTHDISADLHLSQLHATCHGESCKKSSPKQPVSEETRDFNPNEDGFIDPVNRNFTNKNTYKKDACCVSKTKKIDETSFSLPQPSKASHNPMKTCESNPISSNDTSKSSKRSSATKLHKTKSSNKSTISFESTPPNKCQAPRVNIARISVDSVTNTPTPLKKSKNISHSNRRQKNKKGDLNDSSNNLDHTKSSCGNRSCNNIPSLDAKNVSDNSLERPNFLRRSLRHQPASSDNEEEKAKCNETLKQVHVQSNEKKRRIADKVNAQFKNLESTLVGNSNKSSEIAKETEICLNKNQTTATNVSKRLRQRQPKTVTTTLNLDVSASNMKKNNNTKRDSKAIDEKKYRSSNDKKAKPTYKDKDAEILQNDENVKSPRKSEDAEIVQRNGVHVKNIASPIARVEHETKENGERKREKIDDANIVQNNKMKRSKRARVSFDPYNFTEANSKKTTRQRKRSKSDKLFESSGFSSAASTSSELSWIQSHKKKINKHTSRPFRKKPKTYISKNKQLLPGVLSFTTTANDSKSAINVSANRNTELHPSPEVVRHSRISPRVVIEKLSMSHDFSKSFSDIVEEKESPSSCSDRNDSDELSMSHNFSKSFSNIVGQKDTSPSNDVRNDGKSPSISALKIPTPVSSTKKKMLDDCNTDEAMSQYSHISVVKTPQLVCAMDKDYNFLSDLNDIDVTQHCNVSIKKLSSGQVAEILCEPESKRQSKRNVLINSNIQKKNNSTPSELLLQQESKLKPQRKYCTAARHEVNNSSIEFADEIAKTSKLPKKLNFSSGINFGSSFEDETSLMADEESKNIDSIVGDFHRMLSRRRNSNQQTRYKEICGLMMRNLNEVQASFQEFTFQRKNDFVSFQTKLKKFSVQHTAMMNKIKDLEDTSVINLQSLQKQVDDLLQESNVSLKEMMKTKDAFCFHQSKSDTAFEKTLQDLSDRVTIDLKKMTDKISAA